jgi:uncharacterized protein YjiS (DUF1127 family)
MATLHTTKMSFGHDLQSDGAAALSRIAALLRTWRRRAAERRELAAWTERDLNDVALSRADVMDEIGKPFWRS